MSYNVDNLYHVTPDNRGGVKLRLKEHFQTSVDNALARTVTRDSTHDKRSKRVHIHVHDESPVPLDPDLLTIARNKPQNIIQDLYREQAKRDKQNSFRNNSYDQDPYLSNDPTNFLPDEDNDRVIQKLDKPPDGQTYILQQLDTGEVAIILVDDDLNDMTADYKTHRLTADKKLNRLNKFYRRYWTGDADNDRRQTVSILTLLPSQRIELEEDKNGRVLVVLRSPATPDIQPDPVIGAKSKVNTTPEPEPIGYSSNLGPNEVGKTMHETPVPRAAQLPEIPRWRSDDRANSQYPNEALALRKLNAANKEFWSR